MKRIKTLTFLLMIILSVGVSAQNPRSVFTDRPVDEAAIYFTPENFKVKADGRMDVSEALQEALNRTKQKKMVAVSSLSPKECINSTRRFTSPQVFVSLVMVANARFLSLPSKHPVFRKLPGKLQKGNTFLVYRRRLPPGRPYRRCQCRDFL